MDKPSVLPFVPRVQPAPEAASGRGKRRWLPQRWRAGGAAAPGRETPARWGRLNRLLEAARWPAFICLIGLLLGRAAMLEGIAPFAAAYFGVVLYLRRDLAFWAGLSLLCGSFWAAEPDTVAIGVELGLIYVLYRGLEAYERADLSQAPIVVFVSVLLVTLLQTIMSDPPGWLPYGLTAIEASLSFVLTLLFVHALPVLLRSQRRTRLQHEEWIGLVILLASVMTGLTGLSVYGVAINLATAQYATLLFAIAGGPAIGTAVGVVAGIILSLSDIGAVPLIGMLAFGGLMAGLIRHGGRAAATAGLLLGTAVLALYAGDADESLGYVWSALAASLLLFLTPRAWTSTIARLVPGTAEFSQHQHEYAQKVRDLTAERVEKFSEVFRQLSRSFRQMTQSGEQARQTQDFDHFINTVHETTCAGCHRRNLCWDGQFFQTYKLLTEMMSAVETEPGVTAAELPRAWSRHCVKLPQALDVMKRQYELYRHDLHWRRQLQDSRLLVADQLSGVSQVMDDLVKEIRREARQMERQEEQIRDAIEGLGLAVHSLDIVCLEEGRIEIEMVHAFKPGFDECRKMIAPLLSDILGETVTVRSERYQQPAAHLTTVLFASAKAFEVETGVAGAAKDGDLLSGDSFSMTELGSGKFAVALSDGMGNGARARMESSAALSMLEQLLQSGIDERLAVKSVNSVLLLRSPEEMFATVDLALIDLYSAQATMLKIGSTPSFIKRGGEIIPIAANNLPIGILHEIEIDLLQVQLQPGDTLIMMTDGVLDSPGHALNKELWMKRILQEIDADDPQEFADALLDVALRQYPGGVRDDMTVVVTKITRYQPEWAAFRWPGASRMERPRTVS